MSFPLFSNEKQAVSAPSLEKPTLLLQRLPREVKYVCDVCELTGLLDGEHVVEPQGWFSANVFYPLMVAGAYEVILCCSVS